MHRNQCVDVNLAEEKSTDGRLLGKSLEGTLKEHKSVKYSMEDFSWPSLFDNIV